MKRVRERNHLLSTVDELMKFIGIGHEVEEKRDSRRGSLANVALYGLPFASERTLSLFALGGVVSGSISSTLRLPLPLSGSGVRGSMRGGVGLGDLSNMAR
jgi:hypothetical protein